MYWKQFFGWIALALGLVGIAIPVWPTTPFLLLSVGCFSATPHIQKKLLSIPYVRAYHDGYREKRGLSGKTVAVSLLFLWGMLGLSMGLSRRAAVVLLLTVVGLGVSVHILWIARGQGKRKNNSEDNDHEG